MRGFGIGAHFSLGIIVICRAQAALRKAHVAATAPQGQRRRAAALTSLQGWRFPARFRLVGASARQGERKGRLGFLDPYRPRADPKQY